MRTENSIVIRAPLEKIFETTANLLSWPALLPHYRWIHVLQVGQDGMIVKMAARRGWLPIQWTSRYRIESSARELHFEHLKAFTRGMRVVWTYQPTTDGVLVTISHELDRTSVAGRWFARVVLGKLFIHPVASRTLLHFKRYLEQEGA